jgi:hypothetical protein
MFAARIHYTFFEVGTEFLNILQMNYVLEREPFLHFKDNFILSPTTEFKKEAVL